MNDRSDPFGARASLSTAGGEVAYYRLEALSDLVRVTT